MNDDSSVLWDGRFLQVRAQGTWEYVTRSNAHSVVGILAITKEHELVLIEQYRRPTRCRVLEMPAGLAGDDPGSQGEDSIYAAKRELLEETGYVSDKWTYLMAGPSSAGLTDELVELFLAQDAVKEGTGGGTEHEDIQTHLVPLKDVRDFIGQHIAKGCIVDFKILAGLYLAMPLINARHK